MLFSDFYQIQTTGQEDWFDPILDDDTLLFVDPFLIYIDNQGIFQGAYQKVMDFFAVAFEDAARIPYNIQSPVFKMLMNRLVFPEPKEACLGYSIGSVDGAGSGKGFAKLITTAIYDSIALGLANINHFEELGIFNSNIKEDRISDTTINILKDEFVIYTQQICQTYSIPLRTLACRVYDEPSKKWVIRRFQLPINPFNDGPVILIPRKYLATINALNSQDFLDYCWEQYDDNVKDQFNVAIKSNIDKRKIIDIARQNPAWVNQYLSFKEAQRQVSAYDLETDPSGVYLWHAASQRYVTQQTPLSEPTDRESFLTFLSQIAEHFQSYIEEHNGFLTLVDTAGKPKKERAAQWLLYGLIKNFCKSINCTIDLKEAGKGLVNFKFSNNFESPAFLEVKHARNGELLKTFENFLIKTNNGDEAINGYYFVIGFKVDEINKALQWEDDLLELAEEHNFILRYQTIDASF
jgi:hypothetical protein